MKKIAMFFALGLAFIGCVGGFLSSIYHGDYVIAFGIVSLGVMAYPSFIDTYKSLMS